MDAVLHAATLLGGAVTNVATGMNTPLGRASAEHRLPAALSIQGAGVLALVLLTSVGGALASRPSSEALGGVRWWAWAGGAVQAVTIPSVLAADGASGAALLSALTVTGGTTAAVLPDHFGVLGFARRDAGVWRIGGRVVLVARG